MNKVSEFPPSVDELIEEFDDMLDWDERYEYLVELGRELPEIDEQYKQKENLVHGCMSTVWLIARAKQTGENRQLEITADSDSLIVKGLIVVLLSHYSGKSPADVVTSDEKVLFSKLGLDQHLSPNRRNGLFSMVGRIKQLATEMEAQG